MTGPWMIDAHLHFGPPGSFFSAESRPADLLEMMERRGLRAVVCCSQQSLFRGLAPDLDVHRRLHEDSGGRVRFLGPFDPRRPNESLRVLEDAADGPGMAGLKLHPVVHRTSGSDIAYEPAWRFAADRDLPIMTHSWSVSDYNPTQRLSTPEKFEGFARAFPSVKLVLGHAGGRGTGRHEAVRMAAQLPNVYLDIAGDIFCYRLIEDLVAAVPTDRILHGSDWPWMDVRSRLSHVLLADVEDAAKRRILADNAAAVYGLETTTC